MQFWNDKDLLTFPLTDPPVVQANKSQGRAIPHPSFATFMDEKNVVTLLKHHIHSDTRGSDEIWVQQTKTTIVIDATVGAL